MPAPFTATLAIGGPAGQMRILVSAGEASGDWHASELVRALRQRLPEADFGGCAGPRMVAAGVHPVVDAGRLSVVGLVEVLAHLPRIYGEFRTLLRWARDNRPDLAILTDSPDFHLRLAARLHRMNVPVIYLVAPQVWAWRKGRIRGMKRNISHLLCIFPFEEEFFRRRGVQATYIGHPLAGRVQATLSREEFRRKHRFPDGRPLVALLPGSRRGVINRHLPELRAAVELINRRRAASFALALPAEPQPQLAAAAGNLLAGIPVKVIQGETWDLLAHADLALAASGTVVTEAALLGTPVVAFYKVNRLSWWMGKYLVRVPHYTMVNLVAGREVIPELMQDQL